MCPPWLSRRFPRARSTGSAFIQAARSARRKRPGSLTGKRRDTITYVCQRAGRFTIPAARLTWFDLDAKKLQTIDFPARHFERLFESRSRINRRRARTVRTMDRSVLAPRRRSRGVDRDALPRILDALGVPRSRSLAATPSPTAEPHWATVVNRYAIHSHFAQPNHCQRCWSRWLASGVRSCSTRLNRVFGIHEGSVCHPGALSLFANHRMRFYKTTPLFLCSRTPTGSSQLPLTGWHNKRNPTTLAGATTRVKTRRFDICRIASLTARNCSAEACRVCRSYVTSPLVGAHATSPANDRMGSMRNHGSLQLRQASSRGRIRLASV